MANTIKRMVPKVRDEELTGLGTGSNTVYGLKLESDVRDKIFWILWGSGAPGTDYDTAPAGSLYFDFTNSQGYVKNVSTNWTQMT